MKPSSSATLDPREVQRFEQLASQWWDTKGKFRPLHQQGPARLAFIRDTLVEHFAQPAKDLRPLAGLKILDIGCGGGLIAEPLARLGANVTGIDPTEDSIAVARAHAQAQDLSVDYRTSRVEELNADRETFDAVTCLEVIEHVPDVGAFLRLCADLVRPGGVMIVSTINRTWKSYALAIVAAEYVLGWLPRGTHNWQRFVTPDELGRHLEACGLIRPRFSGIIYDLMRDEWHLDRDTDVNYMAAALRPS